MSKNRKIALFGGSFNPPHKGHFEMARHIYEALGVDEVWFLFSVNRQKDSSKYAPFEHRMEMGRIMARHYPDMPFVMSDIEETIGSHITSEVLQGIREKFPDDRFVWVMGADNLAGFHTWQNFEFIMENFPIAVVDRPPYTSQAHNSDAALRYAHLKTGNPADLAAQNRGWCFMDGLGIGLSSSHILEQIKSGQTHIDGLSPDVFRYMTQNRLYGLGQTQHEKLNSVLEQAGVSKTIYALVTPETEKALDDIFGDNGSFLRASFHDMYREAWTQKQDPMHEEFFAVWKEWSSPIVKADWSQFPYMYPIAGASEGIRESINAHGARARVENYTPVIHVFSGEYEGFSAYAAAAGIQVKEHSRKNWRECLSQISPHDQFYISQPSAIDGNVWPDFDEFARALLKVQPSAQLMLDVTYVGCVAKPFEINCNHPNIPTVFFSLSKPLGAYYHRIGGCLQREANPGLFGNKWFKNLLSLRLGTEMMKNHDVFALPGKYKSVQQEAIAHANMALDFNLTPSDVYLLGTMNTTQAPSDLEQYLTRGRKGEDLVRVCLTPTMAKIINPEINNTVKARPHEELEKAP